MVIEQVHLIHIENTAVGCCQHSGFELLLTLLDSMFNIKCTYSPVLSSAYRQINDPHLPHCGFKLAILHLFKAVFTHLVFITGIASEHTPFYHFDLRQETCKRPHSRGFGSPFLPSYKDTTYLRIYSIQQQGFFHLFLPDNGSKRIWEYCVVFHEFSSFLCDCLIRNNR